MQRILTSNLIWNWISIKWDFHWGSWIKFETSVEPNNITFAIFNIIQTATSLIITREDTKLQIFVQEHQNKIGLIGICKKKRNYTGLSNSPSIKSLMYIWLWATVVDNDNFHAWRQLFTLYSQCAKLWGNKLTGK